MSYFQFALLLAAIFIAPAMDKKLSFGHGFVFFIIALFAAYRGE